MSKSTPRSFADGDIAAASLETRLRPPHSLARTLERRSLLDRIMLARERQVLLLQAPAGFGKTTLLVQAMRQWRSFGVECVWLTADRSDSEPGRFLASLAGALRAAGEGDGRPWPDSGGDAEALAAEIALALGRRRRDVALLIDDFHCAESKPFNEALDRLLRTLPPHVRVALSGRARPRVALASLRARGLVWEMSPADLCLSRAETEALIGAQAQDEQLVGFVERCEGWPAPLQLLLQLEDSRDLEPLARRLQATVRDYVEEEVLAPLSAATREFLRACAIAPSFSAELGEALTGRAFEAATRAELAELALLIRPLPTRPDWMSMHPLLQQALVAQLDETNRSETLRLHALAAHWFAARNDFEAAVRHAGAARDFTFAANTIERAGGVRLFIRVGAGALTNLLEKLPSPLATATAGLRLARAVVVAKKGRIAEARRLVEEARELTNDAHAAGDGAASASRDDIVHIDDLIGIYEDREVDAKTLAARERDIEHVPASDTWMRGWIYNHLTIHLCRAGDLSRAEQAAHRSLACYREERATYTQVFMLIHLALINVASGRIAMGAEPAREAERLADAAHPKEDGLRAIAQVPLAEIQYAQNDLVGARRRLDFAIPVMAAGEGWVEVYARALETRIRIALVEEGLGAASGFLDRGYEIARARDLWRLRWRLDAMRHEAMCRTNLLVADDEIGRNLAADVVAGATPQGCALTWQELLMGRLTLARAALYSNNAPAALAWLQTAVEQGEALGAYHWVAPALILRAIALDRSGDAAGGFNAFLRAVAIAAPQGMLRPFVDEGGALSSFVRQAVRRFGVGSLLAASTEFVATILSAASNDGRGSGGSARGLLSEREHEILALLNHGLANKEIARSIGVSEATVKFHLKNLYGKLGVNSRIMALTVARQQRLVH